MVSNGEQWGARWRAAGATDRSLVADVPHILVCLAWLGELSKQQVQRLCVPQQTAGNVGRLLHELRDEGYLTKREWALPRRGGGPPERQAAMWSLTRKGQQIVRDDPLCPRELAKIRARRILAHDAVTAETLVCMIEAGRKVGLSSIWLEHEVRLDPARAPGDGCVHCYAHRRHRGGARLGTLDAGWAHGRGEERAAGARERPGHRRAVRDRGQGRKLSGSRDTGLAGPLRRVPDSDLGGPKCRAAATNSGVLGTAVAAGPLVYDHRSGDWQRPLDRVSGRAGV